MDVVVAYAYAYPGGAIAEELTDVEFAIAAVVARVSTLRIVTVLGRAAIRSFGFAGLAGFAMSRFRARILGPYNQGLLIVQMFPLILAIIPLFIFFRSLNMVNNFIPVILVYTVTQLPFATWMLRSYFDSIPRELDEAAKVDGCSPLRIFLQIILPLAVPGIVAVAIFSFLFSYNEFFISSVFLRDDSRMTMPVGIQSFMQQYSTDWGSLMASATLAMVPTLILFLFIQKYMMSGATAGAVKG